MLKKKNVSIIDDEEAYSQGLSDSGQGRPAELAGHRDRRTTSTSRSPTSLGNRGHPGQHAARLHPVAGSRRMAQHFYTQMRANGKNQVFMGSDGTVRPEHVQGRRSLRIRLPGRLPRPALRKKFKKSHTTASRRRSGSRPTRRPWCNATAIMKACKAGHGLDDAGCGRKQVTKVKLRKKDSLLGFPVAFLKTNKGEFQGPGDMGGAADFGIYRIGSDGKYKRVGRRKQTDLSRRAARSGGPLVHLRTYALHRCTSLLFNIYDPIRRSAGAGRSSCCATGSSSAASTRSSRSATRWSTGS